MAKLTLKAYYPWWFRIYVVAVHTFAYLAGLEAVEMAMKRDSCTGGKIRTLMIA